MWKSIRFYFFSFPFLEYSPQNSTTFTPQKLQISFCHEHRSLISRAPGVSFSVNTAYILFKLPPILHGPIPMFQHLKSPTSCFSHVLRSHTFFWLRLRQKAHLHRPAPNPIQHLPYLILRTWTFLLRANSPINCSGDSNRGLPSLAPVSATYRQGCHTDMTALT